jgi:hypothetical protein
MKQAGSKEKNSQTEVEEEINHLLKQVKSKKSALRKISKLIPDKNEKEHSI